MSYIKKDIEIIEKHLKDLVKEKFIYASETIQLERNYLEYDIYSSPYKIEDLIIDIDNINNFYCFIKNIELKQFETIQVRFFIEIDIEQLKGVVDLLESMNAINIEIIINHFHVNSKNDYINLFNENEIISKIIIMGCDNNEQLINNRLICLSQKLKSIKQCGIISQNLFSVDIRSFLSSKTCNSCLNKKIAIDINGNIKNCPSMQQSYGNIINTTLEEALNHKDFKKYWNITKDQIAVCKDCEFRYICTDCRAYLDQPENIYSKPLKCGYDPYTNEWSEWSTNPLKQKAIAYYGLQELLKTANDI